ncbi:MAG: outer membrane beta-barrel protein [Vicinamibacterales bacterium]
MTKSMMVGVLAVALLAGATREARAQGSAEPKLFAGIEFGAQTTQRTVTSTTSFSLYEETASVTTFQPVHNGPVFGGSLGFKLKPAFGIAAGVTMFNARTADATVAASIPDLLFFNRAKSVTATATGLSHSQLGIHLQAVFFRPLSSKLELVLAGGPSIIKVSHDVATATVATGTQNVTTSSASQTGNAFGFNAGGEVNYRLTQKVLFGIFGRYVAATTDLDTVPDLKLGGVQAGLGLRLRF